MAVEGTVWPEMRDLETLFESRAGMVITENPRYVQLRVTHYLTTG